MEMTRRTRTWTRPLLGAALTVALAAVAAPAHGAANPVRAAELGAQAYVYGFPLMEAVRVRATSTSVACPDDAGNAPPNTFSTLDTFAGPDDRTIVAPNVDTLYSAAMLDLGDGPVVLEHPDMGDRYFGFQLLDPYTNIAGYIGSRTTGSAAGRFAITWEGAPGPAVPDAVPIVVPYRWIALLGRTVAADAADQRAALALMRQYRLTPPGGPGPVTGPCEPGTPTVPPTPRGLDYLDALSAAMEENPPPARDAPMLARLAQIGVGPGLRVRSTVTDRITRAALSAGVRATASSLPKLVDLTLLGRALTHGGWSIPPATIGDYGTDYLTRAGVAVVGLGANTPDEAAYRTAYMDSAGRRLHGRRSYRLRFPPGGEPPADAFWSVTVYDDDGFLVENAENRYAVGDSHPPLVRRADGSIDIVFSRTRPDDEDVNWLPVPPARFRVYLRLYVPREAALTGAWRIPSIRRLPSR